MGIPPEFIIWTILWFVVLTVVCTIWISSLAWTNRSILTADIGFVYVLYSISMGIIIGVAPFYAEMTKWSGKHITFFTVVMILIGSGLSLLSAIPFAVTSYIKKQDEDRERKKERYQKPGDWNDNIYFSTQGRSLNRQYDRY